MIVFYFFAIIGMEVFTGPDNAVFPGCWSAKRLKIHQNVLFSFSVNASFGVGSYYSNNGSTLDNPDLYWLNNFNNLGRSFGKINIAQSSHAFHHYSDIVRRDGGQ